MTAAELKRAAAEVLAAYDGCVNQGEFIRVTGRRTLRNPA